MTTQEEIASMFSGTKQKSEDPFPEIQSDELPKPKEMIDREKREAAERNQGSQEKPQEKHPGRGGTPKDQGGGGQSNNPAVPLRTNDPGGAQAVKGSHEEAIERLERLAQSFHDAGIEEQSAKALVLTLLGLLSEFVNAIHLGLRPRPEK